MIPLDVTSRGMMVYLSHGEMKKQSREITSDREEILSICTDFYKSLYDETVSTPESTMKPSPDTEEIRQFTDEEVERPTEMKTKFHKANGVDGVTSDVINLL